jgi:Flp pilus assembly CpaE family ATPase
MVYKEGTKFIESQPKLKLAGTALGDIQKEKEILALTGSLEQADRLTEGEKTRILQLLEASGARTALNLP